MCIRDRNELVLVQEALQEEKIAQIAEQVRVRSDVRFVLIAGPSSSSKTTFSHRLSVQLRANGCLLYTSYVQALAGREHWGVKKETARHEIRGRFLSQEYDWEGDHTLQIPYHQVIAYSLHAVSYTHLFCGKML